MSDILAGMVIAFLVISLAAAVVRLAPKVFWRFAVLVCGFASKSRRRNDTGIEQERHRIRQQVPPPAFDPMFAKDVIGRVHPISPIGEAPPNLAILAQTLESTAGLAMAAARPARPAEMSDEVLWHRFTKAVDPLRFEELVLEAYFRDGYQTKPTKVVNDDGLDGVLFRDPVAIGVQVKRWNRAKVSSPEIIHFVGSLILHDLEEGHFLTTGKMTRSARRLAERSRARGPRVRIVEGDEMKAFMLKYVRVSIVAIASRSD